MKIFPIRWWSVFRLVIYAVTSCLGWYFYIRNYFDLPVDTLTLSVLPILVAELIRNFLQRPERKWKQLIFVVIEALGVSLVFFGASWISGIFSIVTESRYLVTIDDGMMVYAPYAIVGLVLSGGASLLKMSSSGGATVLPVKLPKRFRLRSFLVIVLICLLWASVISDLSFRNPNKEGPAYTLITIVPIFLFAFALELRKFGARQIGIVLLLITTSFGITVLTWSLSINVCLFDTSLPNGDYSFAFGVADGVFAPFGFLTLLFSKLLLEKNLKNLELSKLQRL